MQAVACAGFGVIAALAVAPAGLFAQSFCSYEITALIDDQSCEFSPTNPAVLDINDHGQACGRLTNCADTLDRPWVWTPEIGLMVLPLPPGADRGEAVGISNELGADGIGAVACTLEGFGIGGQRAFVFDEGVWTELPPANGGFHSRAADMSGTGIVGGARSVGSIAHAFRWQDGAL